MIFGKDASAAKFSGPEKDNVNFEESKEIMVPHLYNIKKCEDTIQAINNSPFKPKFNQQ